MEGWRARLDGSEVRFGSRGSMLCVGSAVRGFCGSQGWTVPGVSVPVCGSVRGLPVYNLRYIALIKGYWALWVAMVQIEHCFSNLNIV